MSRDDGTAPHSTSLAKEPAKDLARRLKRCAIFSAAPIEALERLAERSRLTRFDEGDRFIVEGEIGTAAYLILEGDAAVETNGPLGPQVVARLGAGDLVGEVAAFADAPRTASIRAVAPIKALEIAQNRMREAVAETPAIAMSAVAELGARLQRGNAAMATLSGAAKALAQDRFEPEMLRRLRGQADRFSHFAEVFAEMADEIAEKQRRLREMANAAVIQRSFLPSAEAALDPRVEIAASMTPASEIGGDFFDYFRLGPGHVAVALGDVSGKGAPAAIFMGVAMTVLRTVARELAARGELAPEAAVTHANDILAEDNDEGMFLTLFYGVLDLESGAMRYCAAGHEGNRLLRGGAAPQTLKTTGPAVGFFPGRRFAGGAFQLAAGDALLLHTDGVEEAFNPAREAFGEARLDAALSDATRDPKELIRLLSGAVDAFADGAPQSDDVTLLALRRVG